MIVHSISVVQGTDPEFNFEVNQQYVKDGLIINFTVSIFVRGTI